MWLTFHLKLLDAWQQGGTLTKDRTGKRLRERAKYWRRLRQSSCGSVARLQRVKARPSRAVNGAVPTASSCVQVPAQTSPNWEPHH